MRTKKMLAVLLAVMMVVSMIPIGAAAAVPSDAPVVNIELKSTGTFGELTQEIGINEDWQETVGAATSTFGSINLYKQFGDLTADASPAAPKFTGTSSAGNVDVYEGVLSTAAATSTVEKGGIAYVTIKVTAPDSANGVVPAQVIIKYDTDSFEVPTDKTEVAPNLLATDKAVSLAAKKLRTRTSDGKTFGGQYEAPSAFTNYTGNAGATNVEEGKSVAVVQFGYPSAKATLINATGTTWDYVVPFKVKSTATLGEHTFEAISNFVIGANSAAASAFVPKNPYDGNTQLNTSTASTMYSGDPTSANAAGDRLTYGSTKVTITSNDPFIDITEATLNPAADQEVAVSVGNGGQFVAGIAASDFSIVTEDGTAVTGPTIKIKGTAAGKSAATLQIDASNTALVAGTKYKIKVAANKVEKNGSAVADALTSSKTFTVKAAISGTPSISGTAQYGQTLTATHNTNATTPAYQWYRGTDKISGATSSTYKLVAADIGKTITVEVSDSTGTVYGTAKATDTSAVAKVTLARPTTGTKLGTAATATQDVGATADVTKEGTYTFTTGVVSGDTITMKFDAVYTADMLKTDGNKTGLVATLKGSLLGDNASCYELAAANSETYTADGSVSAAGYKLKGDNDMTFKDSSDTTIAADTVVAGGTEIKVTYDTSKVPSDKELSGFTVKVGTGAAGTTGITSVDTTAGTFTYTTPAGSVTEALDVVFAPTFGTAATPVEFTGLDKTYDGTKAFKGSISTAGVTMSDFNITVEYDSADAGASLTITGDDAGQVVNVKGTDYRVPSTLTGTINKTTAAVSVNTGTGKIAADAGIDAVVAAIKGGAVKIEGVETAQGTVGDYFTNDETIMNAIKTKYPDVYTEGDPGKQPSTEELSDDKTISNTDEVIKGTKFVLPSDATLNGEAITAATEAAGLSFTVGEDGKITVEITGEVTAETAIMFNSDDEKTLTIPALTPVEPVAATEAGWDFSSLAGKNIEIELTLSDADTKTGALFTNVDTTTVTKLAVTAPINRKGQPVVSGSVNFDTQGYGTAEFDTADINGDGKLDALPTMTTKVGLEFRGWSTDGTEAHIVNLETYKPDANEENTLVAVVRGYMVGDGKGKVRPTANITRKELAKMLVVAAGVYDSSVDYTKDPANLFPDMPHDGWSDNYLACAKKFGIMKGNEAGKGTPNANITRNEAAAMIARVFGVKTSADDTTDKVNDFDKVDSWAKKYVAALCNNGTINGKPDGSFSGKMNIQRSEAAKMVNIYLGLDDAKKATIKSDETIKNPFTDIVGDSTWAYADLMFASKSVPASFYVDEITVPEAK